MASKRHIETQDIQRLQFSTFTARHNPFSTTNTRFLHASTHEPQPVHLFLSTVMKTM